MISFTQSEMSQEEIKVKSTLNSSTNSLEERIRCYGGADRFGPDETRAYGSLVECFVLHSLARKKLSALSLEKGYSMFITLYSLNIGARYGLKMLEEQSYQNLRVRSSGNGNLFLNDFEIDLSAPYPRQYNALLKDLSDVLDEGHTKDIVPLARDFLNYIAISTQNLCTNKAYAKFMELMRGNPIEYRGEIFNDASTSPLQLAKKQENKGLTWDDLVGQDKAKQMLSSYCNRMIDLDFYTRFNRETGDVLQNLLMEGPSGVGKTHSARILQNLSGAPFFYINLGDILDTFKDGSSQRIVELFERASAPIRSGISKASILYIDEIDSVGKKRYRANDSGEDTKVTTALISCMSEGVQMPGVVVIGSTNRADMLSGALLERFPQLIGYDLPDAGTQKKLYMHFLEKKQKFTKERLCGPIDYDELARRSVDEMGLRISARAIKNIVNNAINYQADKARGNGRVYHPFGTGEIVYQISEHIRSRELAGREINT